MNSMMLNKRLPNSLVPINMIASSFCRMGTLVVFVVGLALVDLSLMAPLHAQDKAADTDSSLRCDGFELPDSLGKQHALADAKNSIKVIAFLGTECPLAKLYGPRLAALATEFHGQVSIFGINSNSQDSLEEISAYVRRHKLNFPVLKDLNAKLADRFQAQRTPEVFLLDSDNVVRYHGRIDDQYGVGYVRKAPTREDLKAAIQELISSQPISVPETRSVGCIIGRPPKRPISNDITYTADVAKILQTHCIECHRDGQIAPFALTNYDEVVGWAETIREVVEERRMPPWHADPDHGTFANDRSMPEKDKQQLIQWIDNGAPKGNPEQLPKPTTYVEGWNLPGKPDQEIAIRETPFLVPAEGTVEYQYFVVDPKFTEDKWVSAAEIVPGNRDVVHHAIAFVRPPQGERQPGLGWLTAFVPGQNLLQMGEGMARRIPKGSQIVFQMHYTPVGSPAEDLTKLGLIYADSDSVHTEVLTRIAINRDFEIPPNTASYHVDLTAREFPAGSKLLAMAPHMHYRGDQFSISAKTTDNQTKMLLSVPNYDFNWQHTYVLKEPLSLDGIEIGCRATFDNSINNLANPDPTRSVRWGDQTWEEMAMAYLAVAVPRNADAKPSNIASTVLSETRSNQVPAKNQTLEEREAAAQRTATAFFEKLDKNKDGEILRAETPASFRAFAFGLFDLNQDDKLNRREVLYRARLSQRPK